jgi:hypothetical protein
MMFERERTQYAPLQALKIAGLTHRKNWQSRLPARIAVGFFAAIAQLLDFVAF